MTDVAQWLSGLGLAEYASAFAENAIELDVLDTLTDEDLRELGVAAMGHRKRILKAAASVPDTAPTLSLSQSEAESVLSATQSDLPAAASGAERRQLTVMFCDLVGSVALGEQMELEDYRDLLTQFRESVVGNIERNRGFVARHQGDGILAYFGYPRANENDPERAVRSGLDIIDGVATLERFGKIVPSVRVGIATGDAVVGDVLATGASAHSEVAALGATPNLAARLQGEAAPDSVVISQATQSVVAGLFDTVELPPRQLKGITEPVCPFQVMREISGRSRFDARASVELTPFVGREEELEMLSRRWDQVINGQGRVAVLTGVPGIGKSRLLREFEVSAGEKPHERITFQCLPDREHSPFFPLLSGIHARLEDVTGTPGHGGGQIWHKHFKDAGVEDPSARQTLLNFLAQNNGLSEPDTKSETPAQRRENLLRALIEYTKACAHSQPLVCRIEDAHWADPSTREFISRLVGALHDAPIFLLLSARPGFEEDWFDLPHANVLMLSRLGAQEGGLLAEAVSESQGSMLSESLKAILERGEGNPLYIEELTRTVHQTAVDSISGVTIPSSLRDSLMARLDALDCGKPVALAASAIGRNFDAELLRNIWRQDPSILQRGLEELKSAALITEEGLADAARYTFRHNLIHETAYDSLLRESRVDLHHRIASTLDVAESGVRVQQPEVLARHYALASKPALAIACGLDAIRLALSRYAMVEALAHCEAIEVELDKVPSASEREQLELATLLLKGPVLMNLQGSGSPNVSQAYETALRIASQRDRAEDIFTARWGLWLHHQMIGHFDEAQKNADAIVSLGEALSDSTYLLQAHHSAWTTAGHVGDHRKTLAHTTAGLGLYDRERHEESRKVYGDHDAGVCGHAHDAHTHWCLGNFEQAIDSQSQGVALARELSHPPTLLLAETHAAMLYQFLGEREQVRELSERIVALSIEHQINTWRSNGEILLGWVEADEGNTDGFERMSQGTATREAAGSRLRQTYFLAIYAQQLINAGRFEESHRVLESAENCLLEAGEARWEPLLRITQGDLALQVSDAQEAVRCYTLALTVARGQQALCFELVAQCHLVESGGLTADTRDSVSELNRIYAQFSEGWQFAPLSRAKALLEK